MQKVVLVSSFSTEGFPSKLIYCSKGGTGISENIHHYAGIVCGCFLKEICPLSLSHRKNSIGILGVAEGCRVVGHRGLPSNQKSYERMQWVWKESSSFLLHSRKGGRGGAGQGRINSFFIYIQYGTQHIDTSCRNGGFIWEG